MEETFCNFRLTVALKALLFCGLVNNPYRLSIGSRFSLQQTGEEPVATTAKKITS
jgi:hypothetical protein